jgi:predicted enzyme related to lactoylglutathione lyase
VQAKELVLMSLIQGVVARVEVADIDAALPVYEKLTGVTGRRSSRRGVELAWLGQIVLLSGPEELLARYRRAATLLVEDMAAAMTVVTAAGGEVLEGPGEIPGGVRAIARHPDGAVFEYLERHQ